MRAVTVLSVTALFVFSPFVALAFPFGGQIGIVKPCYNNAIYAALGPPRGGPFVWSPSTRTYQFGPPRFVGQWLLGLASAPYYCIVSSFPVIVGPGPHIDMMGSSGPAAPAYRPPEPTTPPPTPTSTDSGGRPFTSNAEYCEFLRQNPNAPQPTVDPCTQ